MTSQEEIKVGDAVIAGGTAGTVTEVVDGVVTIRTKFWPYIKRSQARFVFLNTAKEQP